MGEKVEERPKEEEKETSFRGVDGEEEHDQEYDEEDQGEDHPEEAAQER